MLEELLPRIEVDEKKWKDHPRINISSTERSPEAQKVTLEALERCKFRMNKPFIPPRAYFNTEVTKDNIRHFVDGIGYFTECLTANLNIVGYYSSNASAAT